MAAESCPKCQGPRDAKALYCPFCGVIFARYTAESIPTPATNPLPAAPSPFRAAPAAMSPASPFLAVPATAAATSFPAAPMASSMAATVYGGDLPPEAEATWNPYQGPRGAIASRVAADYADLDLATRGSRLAAQFLNGLGLGGILVLFLVPGIVLSAKAPNDSGAFAMVAGFALALAFWAIINLRQLGQTGQSLGKKWMNIRIVKLDGEPASVLHLVLRRYLAMQVIGIIPVVGPLVSLVGILMIFGDQQRCLHDHIAETKVVKC